MDRFSYSLKQQFVAPKKIYCIDNGMADAVAFQFSGNREKFLENLVFLELRRRFAEIYYYRAANNLEVDFLVKSGKRGIMLIQVADNLHDDQTRKREIDALVKAMEDLNLKSGMILTSDEEENLQIDGKRIHVIPIYRWLLEPT